MTHPVVPTVRRSLARCLLAAWLASVALLVTAHATPAASPTDPDLRARSVEAKLTLNEKLHLVHGTMPLPLQIPDSPPVPPGVPYTAGYIRGVPRLGIPDLLESDASLGVANPLQLRQGDGATALPSGLALAATFDPALAYASGAMMGAESRAKGFNVLLAGGVNLTRDPRNGRNFEYLGEDPLLAGTLAGQSIRGVQSQGVVSTVKHYVLNDQETQRRYLDAHIDEAALRESDLLAFELAIEKGRPGSVMCSYNLVNGFYACGNDHLLNQVLKGDWGYRGWVMSDWGAVSDVSYFNQGLDQESGEQLDDEVYFGAPLKAELAAGRVSRARLSDAVRRILRSVYAVGADQPKSVAPIDYAAHAKIARDAAAAGIVLLKNDGVLPLAETARTILLVGGHADLGVLSGGGSSQVTPSGEPPTLIPVGGSGPMGAFAKELIVPSSPLNALREALPDADIEFASGYDADRAAAGARHVDLVIVFATRWQMEGRDSGSLSLPEGQDELIDKVSRANPNTIVVLETGNPVRMPWLAGVRAVLEAWYPGQEGGAAIADVLTGAVNPSGRLPMTFPVDESQNPRPVITGFGDPDRTRIVVDYVEGADVGYRWFARHDLKPLFAFGYGLSYTRFAYADLSARDAPSPDVSFTVRNTGARPGATTAQIYLLSAAGHPVRRLVAFGKTSLEPGASRQLTLSIDPRLLAHWDSARHGWQIDAGDYVLALADAADQLLQQTTLHLKLRRLPA